MQLKLGKMEYQLYLGIDAMKYLDSVYKIVDSTTGFEFGFGVNALVANFEMLNILAMVHFIKAGTSTESKKPSNRDIEEFLGTLDEDGLENLFKEAKEELKKQPLTRLQMKKMEQSTKKANGEAKIEK